MNYNIKVTNYIENATDKQQIILHEIRKLIHLNVKNASEDIKWNMPVFSQIKNFSYLRFSKNHITLGFYHIDKLKDPNNLLQGEGNTLKHIKITKLDNALKQQITDWLIQVSS